MGRLTTYRDADIYLEKTGYDPCSTTCYKNIGCEDCPIQEAFEKLAHYEDLEEAGRLIELPCAVGEEVWIGHKIYSFGESVVDVTYDSVSSIITAMQDGFVFGRTKEEAEAKLNDLNS